MKHTYAKLLLLIGILSLFAFNTYKISKITSDDFGATVVTVVANFETSLSSSITSSATTATLVSGVDGEGNSLSGTIGFTFGEGTSNEEHIICSASGTSLSSCNRGISLVNPASTSSALQKTHRRGESVKITNYPSLAIHARILAGTDSVPSLLFYPSNQDFSTASSSVITDKNYQDNLVNAGAADASLTVKGISELATVAEVNAGTGLGGTGARLFVNPSYLASSNYGNFLPATGEKDALAGSSGTPGSSNLYITQDDVASVSFSGTDTIIRSDGESVPSGLWLDITRLTIAASASGDIIYHDNTNYTRLAIGGNGSVLTASVGFPIWASVSGLDNYDGTSINDIGDGGEGNLTSFTFQGGKLGTDGLLKTECYFSKLIGSDGITLTIKGYYGATAVTTATVEQTTDSTSGGKVEFIIAADGTTNTQELIGLVQYANDTANLQTLSIAKASASIDSTANQTVKVSAEWSSGGANQIADSIGCFSTLFK